MFLGNDGWHHTGQAVGLAVAQGQVLGEGGGIKSVSNYEYAGDKRNDRAHEFGGGDDVLRRDFIWKKRPISDWSIFMPMVPFRGAVRSSSRVS